MIVKPMDRFTALLTAHNAQLTTFLKAHSSQEQGPHIVCRNGVISNFSIIYLLPLVRIIIVFQKIYLVHPLILIDAHKIMYESAEVCHGSV